MSDTKIRQSFLESADRLFGKISNESLEALANEILILRRKGEIVLDVSATLGFSSYPAEVLTNLSKKLSVDKDTVNRAISFTAYVLRDVIVKKPNAVLDRLKEKAELRSRVDRFMRFLGMKLEEYPEIVSRFYVLSYCKTKYLEDFEWEVDQKLIQPEYRGFQEWERFPVCILRFALNSATAFRRREESNPEQITLELSLDDINKLTTEFAKIKENLIAFKQKRGAGAEKNE